MLVNMQVIIKSTTALIVIKSLDIHRHAMLTYQEYTMVLHVLNVKAATSTLLAAITLTGISWHILAISRTRALSATKNSLMQVISADMRKFTALQDHTSALSVEKAIKENQRCIIIADVSMVKRVFLKTKTTKQVL